VAINADETEFKNFRNYKTMHTLKILGVCYSLIFLLIFNLGNFLAFGQHTAIIPDNSLPQNSTVNISLNQAAQSPGTTFEISGGTIRGGNLFHSFQEFSVGTNHIADFLAQEGISNILNRVTGNTASNIFGTLKSSSNANLFLLNPNGVVFGPSAQLDLRGSLHVSTADFISLGIGPGRFSTTDLNQNLLTSASPSSFGFLNENPASIVFQNGSHLDLSNGKVMSFVAGEGKISIEGGTFGTPDGNISFLGIPFQSNPTTVTIPINTLPSPSGNPTSPSPAVVIKSGVIQLAGTFVSPGEGDVILSANTIDLTNGTISSKPTGAADASSIRIRGENQITLNDFKIETRPQGTGEGGPIILETGDNLTSNIVLINPTISAQVKNLPDPSMLDPEDPGPIITIKTPSLDIRNTKACTNCGIIAGTFGNRNAGDIFINISGVANLSGTRVEGEPAPRKLFINNTVQNPDDFQTKGGKGGNIEISANQLNITLAEIDTRSFFSPLLEPENRNIQEGKAGSITLRGDGHLNLLETGILSDTIGPGASGDIILKFPNGNAFISDNSVLNTKSRVGTNNTLFTLTNIPQNEVGAGGDIEITAQKLTLQNSRITSETLAYGNAGDINLNVNEFEGLGPIATNLPNISSDSLAQHALIIPDGNGGTTKIPDGSAGKISIQNKEGGLASQRVELNNFTISTQTVGDGQGGEISLMAQDVSLNNGTKIQADSTGIASAGNITFNVFSDLQINVDEMGKSLTTDSKEVFISSSGTGGGSAGNISLDVNQFRGFNFLVDSSMSNSVKESVANPGQITIRGIQNQSNEGIESANLLFFDQAQIATNSTGHEKGGDTPGNISLFANNLFLAGSRILAATANEHVAGNIQLNIKDMKVNVDENNNHLTSGGTQIRTDTGDRGNAGNIALNVDNFYGHNMIILSDSILPSGGAPGTISIKGLTGSSANQITLDSAVVQTITRTDDPLTRPGNVSFTAKNLVLQGTKISTDTELGGLTPAGTIRLNIGSLSTIGGPIPGGQGDRGIISSSGSNAGSIIIQGEAGNGARVGENTTVTSKTGLVTLRDTDIKTEGRDGQITISALKDISTTDTGISAFGGGNVSLTTPSLTLTGGGLSAQTIGNQDAGAIILNVGTLTTAMGSKPIILGRTITDGRVQITTNSVNGKAGDIAMQGEGGSGAKVGEGSAPAEKVGTITLMQTDVTTDAQGNGEGGSISLAASGTITLTDSTLSANVNNTATSDTTGADITLTTPDLVMTGGSLKAETTGSRAAGEITLDVGSLTTQASTLPVPLPNNNGATTGVLISSQSGTGAGDAGKVTITGSSTVSLTDTTVSTAAEGTGEGGPIAIGATQSITLTDSTLSANVNNIKGSSSSGATPHAGGREH